MQSQQTTPKLTIDTIAGQLNMIQSDAQDVFHLAEDNHKEPLTPELAKELRQSLRQLEGAIAEVRSSLS